MNGSELFNGLDDVTFLTPEQRRDCADNLVSERALIKRINRTLRRNGQKLIKPRSRHWRDVGPYCVLDLERGLIVLENVDLEHLGRELGVMQRHEALAA